MIIQFDNLVDDFFGEARERLGDDYLEVLDKCGIPSDTSSFSKLPATKLNLLCNELFVTFDSIASGRVDFVTMENHLKGGSKLPSKYISSVPYSSRFTSVYMLNYLRSILGNEPVKFLCQHFQLKEDQFTDISEKNNLLLPHDICSYVRTYFGEDVVKSMGESSFELFSKTKAARELASQKSVKEFFDKFITEVMPVHVEKNYDWKIDQSGANHIQISGRPLGDVSEALSFRRNGVEALETLRAGFIQALPRLMGINDAEVEKIRSISGGDSVDTYLISYGKGGREVRFIH